MKFSIALAIATAFTSVQAIAVSDEGELFRRQCVETDCSCMGVPKDGLFCGDGFYKCKLGYVYQCGEGGTKSCEYGPRKTCQECGSTKC